VFPQTDLRMVFELGNTKIPDKVAADGEVEDITKS
jgi:hypothetical protein